LLCRRLEKLDYLAEQRLDLNVFPRKDKVPSFNSRHIQQIENHAVHISYGALHDDDLTNSAFVVRRLKLEQRLQTHGDRVQWIAQVVRYHCQHFVAQL